MSIDEISPKEAIESFERVEPISDIIIIGIEGGIRRVMIE